jgi:hypothetical protein
VVVFAAVCSRIEEVLMCLTPCLRACKRTHNRSDTPRSPADPWSADDAAKGLQIIVHASGSASGQETGTNCSTSSAPASRPRRVT